ncbi:unnamed protein product [Pedinophyceae sp. YPF-701]|nr:unnamed protein product [Pedinophyceae sp. YPF-701]
MSDQPTARTQKELLERLRGLRKAYPLGECSEQGCDQEAVFEKVFSPLVCSDMRRRCYCLRHGSWWMDEKVRELAPGTWMVSSESDMIHHLFLLLGNHIRPGTTDVVSLDKTFTPGCQYRPDVFIDGPERGVLIENDENGHFGYSGPADRARTVDVHKAAADHAGKPVHLIRFRPDEYEDENGVWGMHFSWVHRLYRLAVSVFFAMFCAEGPAQVDDAFMHNGRLLTVERLFYGAYPGPPAELLTMLAPKLRKTDVNPRDSFKTTWQQIFEAVGGSPAMCEALKDIALQGRVANVPLPAAADDAACKDRRFQRLPRPYGGVGSPEPLAVPPGEQAMINADAQAFATKFGLGDVEHFDA